MHIPRTHIGRTYQIDEILCLARDNIEIIPPGKWGLLLKLVLVSQNRLLNRMQRVCEFGYKLFYLIKFIMADHEILSYTYTRINRVKT